MKNKVVKKLVKFLVLFVLFIVAIIASIQGIVKPILYKEYYSIYNEVCKNPGLNSGFIPQGIAVDEYNGQMIVLTSGYMDDDSPSRIYITNEKDESRYLEVYVNDGPSKAHLGGIAISNGVVYLCRGKAISVISLDDLMTAKDKIIIKKTHKIFHQASACFADDKYLYVPEFASGGSYEKEHYVETNDGIYTGICSVYSLDDLDTPLWIYSIRNKVQGLCVTDSGNIVLSTSQSFKSSEYYVYNKEDIRKSDTNYICKELDNKELPLYILDNPSNVILGPCMSEDLSYYNGKVYSLTESACNKYILGKLFFAYDIFSLDIE
jgi:hypothetical protein